MSVWLRRKITLCFIASRLLRARSEHSVSRLWAFRSQCGSVGRWRNVNYSACCYYFSLFWLHNQLKLVSLCFMYHEYCTISSDSITSTSLFLQRYRSSLKTGPARDITHQRHHHIPPSWYDHSDVRLLKAIFMI